jgi:thiamine pyrophosphate-dependent acetolactate synthase large subunit-like protein
VLRRKDLIKPPDRSAWKAKCEGWRKRYPLNSEYPAVPEGALSMYRFAETLSDCMEGSDVVASGSFGFACEIFLLVVEAHKNQRVFHSRGMGAMGFGLPASIGVCFASGKRRTICVDGDGGFQMNVQELATIAQHGLPIKLFIIDNRGYSSIRSSQSNYFKLCVGCDDTSGLTLPSAAAVARAYGLAAVFGQAEYEEIDRHCRETGIAWFASCWDEPSSTSCSASIFLCFKIASATLTDDKLLKHTRLPASQSCFPPA